MKKFGFTLAEVLVTLSIVGVVSALTVPSVIGAFEEKELQAQAKKAYNTLQSAVNMKYVTSGLTPASTDEQSLLTNFLAKEDRPALKYTRSGYCGYAAKRCFELSDGQVITSGTWNRRCSSSDYTSACAVIVDVNGVDGPTFSSVDSGGTNLAGNTLTKISRSRPTETEVAYNASTHRSRRDIVYFMVNGLSVTPWMNDPITRRYFSGQQ